MLHPCRNTVSRTRLTAQVWVALRQITLVCIKPDIHSWSLWPSSHVGLQVIVNLHLWDFLTLYWYAPIHSPFCLLTLFPSLLHHHYIIPASSVSPQHLCPSVPQEPGIQLDLRGAYFKCAAKIFTHNSPYPSYLKRGINGLGLYYNLPSLRGNRAYTRAARTLIFTM